MSKSAIAAAAITLVVSLSVPDVRAESVNETEGVSKGTIPWPISPTTSR